MTVEETPTVEGFYWTRMFAMPDHPWDWQIAHVETDGRIAYCPEIEEQYCPGICKQEWGPRLNPPAGLGEGNKGTAQ